MNADGALSRLNRPLARLLQWLLVCVFSILVVVVLWGVGSRYLLGSQASWSEELARLLMVWLALLGSALVCREEKHLGLDVVVRAWPDELQRLARMFGYAAIFAFALLILGWGGWQLVGQRFDSGQTLPALGISRAWFYLALPVSGILTALFMLELFLSCLLGKSGKEAEEVPS